MFSAECRVTVKCEDGEIVLAKWVDLPFAPFVGLMITWDEDEPDYCVVSHVDWFVPAGVFWLSCEDESEGMRQEQIEYYQGHGWELLRDGDQWIKESSTAIKE